jgi:2-amino-4-hydroxy-6-hydroxymethyldihydropteridine diphosphokinase
MGNLRSYYLSLGSNISPERHLQEAIRRLREYGEVREVSSAWESHAVGSDGPDFLNVCVGFAAAATAADVKCNVADPIESELGRIRTGDKYAPRTIDIDIVMDSGRAMNLELWNHAFVVLPMSELLPDASHPLTGRRLADEAARTQASTWIRRRPDAMKDPDGEGTN